LLVLALSAPAGAQAIPPELQMPGTQPNEISELEAPNKCDNCHGGYDLAVEPTHNWLGSMMAQSIRDPLFWATVAVAEQDFPQAGDLCIRCHSPEGWVGGRSTPTDGSGLKESDAAGVMCDACHQMVDPSGLEHPGAQFAPFVANDGGAPPEGYHGSGMAVFSQDGNVKLGPYSDPTSPHPSLQSGFHRKSEQCGTCHDVSNPVVGDLAPGNGAQLPLAPGTFSGTPGSPVDGKAAFNNFPFAYGAVERTYSEHAAGLLSRMRVAEYADLPEELRAGSIERAWQAAFTANPGSGTPEDPGGDYLDGTPRVFSCQTCHMPPVTGKGCDKASAPVRADLPHHDLTGGNTWVPQAIEYLDSTDRLLLGGGLDSDMTGALQAGAQRAAANLRAAAALDLTGNHLRIVNLTGHKLLTGFPEGRRMWLRVTWRDGAGAVARVDGEYGPMVAQLDGAPTLVETILYPELSTTHLFEAHLGMTQEWAASLVSLGWSAGLVLTYDRVTGAPTKTLGQLASEPPGSAHETFHFVLNDVILGDNRIPPYGYDHDEAERRSALPVPRTLYGDPGPGGTYEYWAEALLEPPGDASTADIELLYQTTSWEYVQFLALADADASPFLADAPESLLDAWLNTGMSPPQVMATAQWSAFPDCNGNGIPDADDISGGGSDDCNGNGVPDECEPSVELVRLGTPPNPDALRPGATSGPVLGKVWDPAIDHSSFMPAAAFDFLSLSAAPLNIPTEFGTLLCTPALYTFVNPASAPFAVSIPSDCSFLGAPLCFQGASWDGTEVSGTSLRLTSALDVTLGEH
jgi:hypothetical protein